MDEKLFLKILNKPIYFDIIGVLKNNQFQGFTVSTLEVEDLTISTDYGKLTLYKNGNKINLNHNSVDITNWLFALLNYIKEKKLVDDFKNYYK